MADDILTSKVKSVDLGTSSTSKPAARQIDNWDGVISTLEAQDAALGEMPTKAELEKEQRRYRTQKTVGAIGDTVSALANLFATTQYAPSAYKPENSMSAKAQARHDKMMQEYRDKQDQHLNYATQIARIKDNRDQLEYSRARQQMQDEIAQAKADREQRAAELNAQYLAGKITAQEQTSLIKEAENDYKSRLAEARINALNSQASYNNRRSAGGSGRGSGRNGYYTETTTKDGVVFDRYGNAHNVKTTTTKNRAPYTGGSNNSNSNDDLEAYRRGGSSLAPLN